MIKDNNTLKIIYLI